MAVSDFSSQWPIPERRVLTGRWCRLEPLDPERHRDALFEAISGEHADAQHRFLADPIPTSRADFQAWLIPRATSEDPMYFAVIDLASGRTEGRQSLMDIFPGYGTAEIGHILWGPRIARSRVSTEAFFLLTDYVMTDLRYRRWQWRCNALNEPSRRAADRFGFTFEGIFRNHMVVKGKNRDTAWYSITDEEWPKIRARFIAWLDPSNFRADGFQVKSLRQ
ncbi:GNAT family protein [uncultured Marivita sp.]|uniref:GNAT family N-acetyltransferase n=1 Tax=uncultured Marivita sp. TaxID=888080 RepID=UPI002606ECD5|nr:GNAT family protein [uncultured Marivita sp.]